MSADPTIASHHARVMDAAGFWRQFVVAFYFDRAGDELTGAVVKYWSDGRGDDAAPAVRIQTDDGRRFDVTAHQERLKAELVKAAPAVGDRIRIRYDGEAERAAPGMNKAKLFTVALRRAGSQPPGGTEKPAEASENVSEAGN